MSDLDPISGATKKKRIIITVSVAGLCLLFLAVLRKGLDLNPSQIPSALLNKPALDFKARWLQGQEHLNHASGETFSLKDFKGRGLILNFWASWCYSCREEAHDFQKFWESQQNSGISLVGIAIQDSPADALAFARQYGKTYILGLDDDGSAAINYGVTGVPETFVISPEGKILYKEAGPVSAQKLKTFAAMLLPKTASQKP